MKLKISKLFMSRFFKMITVCFLLGCNTSQKNESAVLQDSSTMNSSSWNEAVLHRDAALANGDTAEYELFRDYFIDAPNLQLWRPALIMANKYNCPKAFEDMYYCITDVHRSIGSELDSLDPKTKTLALNYLKQGSELGNKECMEILGKLYLTGLHLEKDSLKGRRLLEACDYYE